MGRLLLLLLIGHVHKKLLSLKTFHHSYIGANPRATAKISKAKGRDDEKKEDLV